MFRLVKAETLLREKLLQTNKQTNKGSPSDKWKMTPEKNMKLGKAIESNRKSKYMNKYNECFLTIGFTKQ